MVLMFMTNSTGRFEDTLQVCLRSFLRIAMKQIQDWLGHSTFNTTADIYSHLDFSSKQDSANAISAALNPLQEEPEAQQGMTMQM